MASDRTRDTMRVHVTGLRKKFRSTSDVCFYKRIEFIIRTVSVQKHDILRASDKRIRRSIRRIESMNEKTTYDDACNLICRINDAEFNDVRAQYTKRVSITVNSSWPSSQTIAVKDCRLVRDHVTGMLVTGKLNDEDKGDIQSSL